MKLTDGPLNPFAPRGRAKCSQAASLLSRLHVVDLDTLYGPRMAARACLEHRTRALESANSAAESTCLTGSEVHVGMHSVAVQVVQLSGH